MRTQIRPLNSHQLLLYLSFRFEAQKLELVVAFEVIFKSFKLKFSLIFLILTLLNPSFFPLFLYHYLILRLKFMITAFLFPSLSSCCLSLSEVAPLEVSC